jgi:hypothetical protein
MTPTIALLLPKFAQMGEEMKKYQRQYQRFPLRIPQGPHTELKGAYEELHLNEAPPTEGVPCTDGFWNVLESNRLMSNVEEDGQPPPCFCL